VYKSKKVRDAEKAAADAAASVEDITEQIEAERAKLPSGGTPVTAETFAKWKAERDAKRAAEVKARVEEELKKSTGGGVGGSKLLSGRALFTYDPSIFVDDAEAGAEFDEGDEEGGGLGGGVAEGEEEGDGSDGEEEGEVSDEEGDEADSDEGEEANDSSSNPAGGGGPA